VSPDKRAPCGRRPLLRAVTYASSGLDQCQATSNSRRQPIAVRQVLEAAAPIADVWLKLVDIHRDVCLEPHTRRGAERVDDTSAPADLRTDRIQVERVHLDPHIDDDSQPSDGHTRTVPPLKRQRPDVLQIYPNAAYQQAANR